MSDPPRKRSRFDQTEPDPPRKSRFDQTERKPRSDDRSRSPVREHVTKKERERSPAKPVTTTSALDKAKAQAAALAAAAKINASIAAKQGIQHVDVPPIRAAPAPPPPPVESADKDVYQQDGDFIKDIEVNDLRNRYTLTKGATQKQIKDETGADVTTRGEYYPDKSMATAMAPPLYLHVTSTTKEGLEKAVAMIEDLMKQELPDLIDQRRFRRREPDVERDAQGRRKWPEAKISIDLEPIPGFNLRASVVGQQGAHVKHIVNETGARVQIKGRGSGFIEPETGEESQEAMYLHVAGREQEIVDRAKELCLSLVANITQRYEAFKVGGGNGGYNSQHGHSYQGRRDDREDYGGYGGYGRGNGSGPGVDVPQGGGSLYCSAYGAENHFDINVTGAQAQAQAQAQVQTGLGMTQEQISAWTAYYSANPQEDPYRAQGGFAAYIQYCSQYAQQYGAAPAGNYQGQNNNNEVPPPPPPPPPSY